jgi:hypothetical protein
MATSTVKTLFKPVTVTMDSGTVANYAKQEEKFVFGMLALSPGVIPARTWTGVAYISPAPKTAINCNGMTGNVANALVEIKANGRVSVYCADQADYIVFALAYETN